jgi:hypothetical protein
MGSWISTLNSFIDTFIETVRRDYLWAIVAVYALVLFVSVRRGKRHDVGFLFLLGLISVLIIGFFIALAVVSPQGKQIRFTELLLLLFVYGVAIFIIVSDVLRFWGARFLTKKRGDKWTKEIDYLYLLLGAAGIVASTGRLPFVTGQTSQLDVVGPLVLTTALVIRLIKTRAEIEGWNKVDFVG